MCKAFLDFGAKGGGMESGYDPDGLSIKGPRVPWRRTGLLSLHAKSQCVFFDWHFSQPTSLKEVRAVFTISPHATHAARLPLLAGVDTPQQFCLHFYPVIGPTWWGLIRRGNHRSETLALRPLGLSSRQRFLWPFVLALVRYRKRRATLSLNY